MIPRTDTPAPCASCGAPAEAELCEQCLKWAAVDALVKAAQRIVRGIA